MIEVDDHEKSCVQWAAIELHGKREIIHPAAEEMGVCRDDAFFVIRK
jgi:hypothetical protein